MSEYYLVNRNEDTLRKKRILDLGSRIAIFHDLSQESVSKNSAYYDSLIQSFWRHDSEFPNASSLIQLPKGEIKWYINNKITLTDPVWNGDYLHGISVYGKIEWSEKSFPSLVNISPEIFDIIRECPFSGKRFLKSKLGSWRRVAALYLRCDNHSPSFLAGVFTGGEPFEKDGLWYAKFDKKIMSHVVRWGIPIEHEDEDYFLISLIWPSLFTYKMPESISSKWDVRKKAAKAHEYAAILWTIYVDTWYIKEAIPYLKSRRWVFYHYKCDEGAKKHLETLRVKLNLTGLDYSIRAAVHDLANRYNGSQKARNKK